MCQKIRYVSRSSAEFVLAKMWRTGRRKQICTRAYSCPSCHGWHLTRRGSVRKP